MNQFENRIAVITGAASGFGRAYAQEAARRKMRLVLADVDSTQLAAVSQALRTQGAEVVEVIVDVSQEADVSRMADACIAKFGIPHLVFNNAGVGCGGLVWESTVKDWQWVLGVNLWGVVHGLRAFMPRMLQAAKSDPSYEGHMINVASVAGLLNPTLLGVYNVSKHAVVSLSESLYHDLANVQRDDQRVHASVVCPAFVPTGIGDSHRNRPSDLRDNAAPTDSMRKAHALVGQAVSGGQLSADDVAQITFEAIEERRFYVLTHPQFVEYVKLRLDDIANLRNPRRETGAPPR